MTARGADCPLGPAHVHDASASPNAAQRLDALRAVGATAHKTRKESTDARVTRPTDSASNAEGPPR